MPNEGPAKSFLLNELDWRRWKPKGLENAFVESNCENWPFPGYSMQTAFCLGLLDALAARLGEKGDS